MIRFVKKHKTVLLLILCLCALGEGVYSGLLNAGDFVVRNRYTNFVMSQYHNLDVGEYGDIADVVIEGRWEKIDGKYQATGLLNPRQIEELLIDDLGVRGWRIRFVILKPIDFYTLDREELAGMLPREHAVLELYDPVGKIEEVPVVVLTGHVTGRCTIVDWVRPVPVVRTDEGMKMIIRGMPEVYYLIHKEQWFKPVQF